MLPYAFAFALMARDLIRGLRFDGCWRTGEGSHPRLAFRRVLEDRLDSLTGRHLYR